MNKAPEKKKTQNNSNKENISSLGAHEKYCSGCAAKIHIEALACPKCGYTSNKSSSQQKNRIIAALLALFLGGIGIHKFYMGRTNEGVIYLGGMLGGLFFFWLIIPLFFIPIIAIAAFCDFVYLLCINDKKFDSMCK
ncbi:TM2 domain-containing protein [Patescibacteria group bacterium]|nr:TM2 domain-containing protein [Patescibacteria group bacterium]